MTDATPPPPLPDGRYDAIVVDAEALADGAVSLTVTVLAGPHKGEVIELRGPGGERDPVESLGVPATLTVTDGQPRLTLEP